MLGNHRSKPLFFRRKSLRRHLYAAAAPWCNPASSLSAHPSHSSLRPGGGLYQEAFSVFTFPRSLLRLTELHRTESLHLPRISVSSFSMASSLEDDLSCAVCCELYQDPQLLSCGHTFCRQCLKKHWSVNTARTCPVCRRVSPQEPVANLALRNTCESYQREKERQRKETESGSDVRCPQHGEKVQFFCKTDNELVCSSCKKENHRSHRVQLLAHAVRQHKVRETGRETQTGERRGRVNSNSIAEMTPSCLVNAAHVGSSCLY